MVLQQFILLLRNILQTMNNIQVMVAGRRSLAYLGKKCYKVKKKRNKGTTGSGTIMLLFSLYFQRKTTTTTLHRDFLPFFPIYVAGGEDPIACL